MSTTTFSAGSEVARSRSVTDRDALSPAYSLKPAFNRVVGNSPPRSSSETPESLPTFYQLVEQRSFGDA